MRKHRFFISSNLEVGAKVNLDPDLSHYIGRVLRLAANDQIFLFNNSGYEFQAVIENITRNNISVVIKDSQADTQESPLRINLAQVIAKGEKMDMVIQKATELGVHSITPLYSERTVVRKVVERSEHKLEHWQKIAIAASCQSWRNYVPVINNPLALDSWLMQTQDQHKLILSTTQNTKRLKDLKLAKEVTILIGPEGGFSEEELHLAIKHGFTAISLGPRILRTETAGIATISILQSLFGDC
jgi:16S rRNA (uracil1498-N3)-methyltransferase